MMIMNALGRELAVYRHLNLYRFNSLASALSPSEIKIIRPIERNLKRLLSAILSHSMIEFSVESNGIDRPISDIRWLRSLFYLINLVGIKRHVFDVCFEVKTCHYLSLVKQLELPQGKHLNSFIRVCFELVLSFLARQFEALGISEFRVYLVNK
jgi:hypothetical protein